MLSTTLLFFKIILGIGAFGLACLVCLLVYSIKAPNGLKIIALIVIAIGHFNHCWYRLPFYSFHKGLQKYDEYCNVKIVTGLFSSISLCLLFKEVLHWPKIMYMFVFIVTFSFIASSMERFNNIYNENQNFIFIL